DRFFFDFRTRAGGTSTNWRLVDPHGNDVFSQPFNGDAGYQTLPATGAYTLLVEGGISDPGPVTYRFNVQPVPVETGTVASDVEVDRTVSTAGEEQTFTFQGTEGQRIDFDGSEANVLGLAARLVAPSGATVFSLADVKSNSGPLVLGETGTYRLVVDA